MTTTKSIIIPLQIQPGVQPSTDRTAFATTHYTAASKIRFRFGFPQKIGGWNSVTFNYGAAILGVARSLFSAILSTALNTLIGTNTKLYTVFGSVLINITPLSTSTTAIANSLTTDYGTLASNPITTSSGSSTITIADTNAANYVSGDDITISGATAVGGILAGTLNTQHEIHTIGTNSYTVIVGSTASSGATGGGASVVRATGRVTVAATAHGFSNGQRVSITGAVAFGGITAPQMNMQWIIRNVTTNAFDVMTAGTATSSVSAAGGAGTAYAGEIASGAVNEAIGQGYGCGLYGVGLYGTALLSSTGLTYPRIWFMDRFGSDIIMTPGNQTGLYAWTGSSATAPALISNAPTAINYAFVSNNIIVTFGYQNIGNQIFTCDQGNMTQWTSSSSNQVFQDTVEGAGTFISHVPVGSNNLIFTSYQTYLFSYAGFSYTSGTANLNPIWNIQLLENNVGIIAPMARVSIMGTAYWMGQKNFYMYTGGNVSIIPASDQTQSTMLNYVFNNINTGQSYKSFAFYNEQFDEIWFHYPSAMSNECDSVVRLNRTDLTWTPDTFDRTCAEYPNLTLGYPRMVSAENIFYNHEQGTDADGSPMAWSLTGNLRGGDQQKNYAAEAGWTNNASTKNYMLTSFIPDSIQTDNITVNVTGYRYPQSSSPMFDNNYTVTPTTEFVPVQGGARFWQYEVSGNTLGQSFTGGQWMETVQESSQI
jgi:hypothetical protein